MASANSRTFACLSVKTVSWTLFAISGVVAVFTPPRRGAFSVLVAPRLNSLVFTVFLPKEKKLNYITNFNFFHFALSLETLVFN